jgi:hypothetical protein
MFAVDTPRVGAMGALPHEERVWVAVCHVQTWIALGHLHLELCGRRWKLGQWREHVLIVDDIKPRGDEFDLMLQVCP